jgi:hypothetical protein
MSSLLVTLGFAFTIILIAVVLMAIGLLLKGKSILRPGACGRDPTKNRDEVDCGSKSSCSLCEKEIKSQQELLQTDEPVYEFGDEDLENENADRDNANSEVQDELVKEKQCKTKNCHPNNFKGPGCV